MASQSSMAGVKIEALSKFLGHKSIKMTQRYAHFFQEYLLGAMNIVGDKLKDSLSEDDNTIDKKETFKYNEPKYKATL